MSTDLHKVFQKVEEEGIFPSLFYEASISLILNLDKDRTNTKLKPISIMNINVKILNKMVAKRIQHIYKNYMP